MATIGIGDKVSYRTVDGSTILGKVLKFGRDELGDFIEWRVTSRKSMVYVYGTIERTNVGCPWFSKR